MTPHSLHSTRSPSSAGFFARLLLVVFAVDMVEMFLFFDVIARLNLFSAALADAALLVLGSAPLVWFAVIRPLAGWNETGGTAPRFVRAGMFIKLLTVIFLFEVFIMLALPALLPHANPLTYYLADALITIFLCAPLLWLIMSLDQRNRMGSLADLLGTPWKLYVLLLGTVFIVDLLEMPFVQLFALKEDPLSRKLIDAFITTLIVAPPFWWLLIWPLRKAALLEKTRSEAIQAQVVEAIVVVDEEGMIESFNPAAERIFGYPTQEIIGKPATLLFHETGRSLDELLGGAAAFENGRVPPVTHEALGRQRDGSTLVMDLSLSSILLDKRRQSLMIMRDISVRKKSERALQRSMSLLTATLESTADGILVVDTVRRIRTFNQKFLDMWRIPRHVAEGSGSCELLSLVKEQLQDPEAFLDRVGDIYSQPEATALEIIRFKDGRVFERYSQPQLLEGDCVGRVWSFRDITVKTQAEEALRASEERFKMAIIGANDGIWDWNIRTGSVYFTPRLKEMLGFAAEELPDMIESFQSLLHPADYDRIVQAVRSHLKAGAPCDIECRLRTKAGDYRWFRARGQAVWDEAGKAVRMAGSVSDITERKQVEEALRASEERFRQLFEQSEDAIILFKPGTCSIIDVNPTVGKLFGYTKTELMEGGLERLTKPEEFARLSSAVCRVRHGEMSSLDNIAGLRKDGSGIIVSMRGKMVILQGVPMVYTTFRDVTERIHLEEEARDIQAKLILANKMTSLGLLVSGVAHEINNPNNFIMANSQLLARTWEDAFKVLREYYRENGDFLIGGIPFSEMSEHAPQLFRGITEGSRRINEIVNNLKQFSRQDRSGAERDVDCNQVVTSAVSLLLHQINNYTENFRLDLAEKLPPVRGSHQQLEQVVINLLTNACQALPARECGVRVTTGFDAASGQVTITVRDEGRGIPRDIITKVLEPFFTTKLDSGGTGLGLAISNSIIKDHNGSLNFESEPGKGTTFIVKIPAADPAVKEHDA
ncbi:MAG: PAS domain-containing sensor histidine [Geobacteraceae bacterium]|nr:MAG: PAS domain-containing sensor histidine [Geobacteraceae bacterium]